MKFYNPKPNPVIRVCISGIGQERQYFTFDDTTQKQCASELQHVLKPHINPFATGKVTNVQIREAVGAKNGKCISFAFKGLSAVGVAEIINKKYGNDK